MSNRTVIRTVITPRAITRRVGPAGAGGGSATWGGITGTLSAQTDLQTALNLKARLASPALTGTPTAPTAATTTSTTQVATTAFVQQELAAGVAVAKNLEFLAHNGSGVTIAKGSIVYINGAVGGVPRITKAQGNNDTNSARTIGFVKADITNGSNGFVIIEGELQNVSTADSIDIVGAGIQLYLSPTIPGAFTRTKPSAPNHLVYVGVVVTASTGANLDGKILVGIQNGYELNEIHDVSITAPVAAKQVIKRNAGNTLWVNEAIVSADVSDATNAATPNTLVRRDASGAAEFVSLTVTGGTTFGEESLVQFDALEYYYGTGAASAHRTALGSGATGDALFTAVDLTSVRSTIERRVFVKPTDTIKNADATLAADPYFQNIPVSAGVYRIYVELMGTTQSTSGLLSRLVHPANSRPASYITAIAYGGSVVGLTIPATGTTTTFGNMTANGTRANHGFLDYTFASSGTIAVEWAQNTSGVFNTTLHAGSYLIIERLS